MGLLGLGSAAAVVGGVFGLQAIVKARNERAQCGDGSICTNEAAVKEHDQGNTFADVSTVMIPLGLVAAAAGAVIVLTTHGSLEAAAAPGQARLGAKWIW
jgi:hypothetical protein